jgi:hypothetical protein
MQKNYARLGKMPLSRNQLIIRNLTYKRDEISLSLNVEIQIAAGLWFARSASFGDVQDDEQNPGSQQHAGVGNQQSAISVDALH